MPCWANSTNRARSYRFLGLKYCGLEEEVAALDVKIYCRVDNEDEGGFLGVGGGGRKKIGGEEIVYFGGGSYGGTFRVNTGAANG